MRSVDEHQEHLALHDRFGRLFWNVSNTFIQNLSPYVWLHHFKSNLNTLCDKFCAMIRDLRNLNQDVATAPDIHICITKVDQLLDDLISEKNSEDKDPRSVQFESEMKTVAVSLFKEEDVSDKKHVKNPQ